MNDALLERRVLELERIHVHLGLVPCPLDGVVRGGQVDPAQPRHALVRARAGHRVAPQRLRSPFRIGQWQPAQTGVPDALGRDLGDEHEPAVGELRRAVRPFGLEHQFAHELTVDVGRPELASRAEPAGVDLAAADQPAGLDVEDVGEIGLELDLDRQADRPPPVVDDVVVLVDATGDRPVEPDGEAVAGDDAVAVEQLGVGVLEPGGIELDRRGVEQQRPAAVEEEVVARHEARVPGEEALLRLALDAPVGLAHDEPVVPVHGDRRWPDLDREGHGRSPDTVFARTSRIESR